MAKVMRPPAGQQAPGYACRASRSCTPHCMPAAAGDLQLGEQIHAEPASKHGETQHQQAQKPSAHLMVGGDQRQQLCPTGQVTLRQRATSGAGAGAGAAVTASAVNACKAVLCAVGDAPAPADRQHRLQQLEQELTSLREQQQRALSPLSAPNSTLPGRQEGQPNSQAASAHQQQQQQQAKEATPAGSHIHSAATLPLPSSATTGTLPSLLLRKALAKAQEAYEYAAATARDVACLEMQGDSSSAAAHIWAAALADAAAATAEDRLVLARLLLRKHLLQEQLAQQMQQHIAAWQLVSKGVCLQQQQQEHELCGAADAEVQDAAAAAAAPACSNRTGGRKRRQGSDGTDDAACGQAPRKRLQQQQQQGDFTTAAAAAAADGDRFDPSSTDLEMLRSNASGAGGGSGNDWYSNDSSSLDDDADSGCSSSRDEASSE